MSKQFDFDFNLNQQQIYLAAALTTDHTANGIVIKDVTAGEEIAAFGTALYQKNDGKFWKSDASASATMPVIALSLNTSTVAADATMDILIYGFVIDTSWTWTIGGGAAILYASATPGLLTHTPPAVGGDQIQFLALAIHATMISFNPSFNLEVVP